MAPYVEEIRRNFTTTRHLTDTHYSVVASEITVDPEDVLNGSFVLSIP